MPKSQEIIIVMLAAGCWGSSVNFFQGDKQSWKKFSSSFLTGIGASFLVPLFLNTIESNLVDQVTSEERTLTSVLVFSGFCLLAAISSEAFVNTLRSKLLDEEVQKAQKQAEQANKNAEQAKKITEDTINRITERDLMVAQGLLFINGPGAIDEALELSEKVLKENCSNIKAILLKAVALIKRKVGSDLEKAFSLLNDLIGDKKFNNNDNQSKGRAFYNRACCQILSGNYNEDDVYSDLEKAFQLYPELGYYANYKDEDFKNLKDETRFKELTNKYKNIEEINP